MHNQSCPRVLVLSINVFNKSGSNGKVLGELFDGWDKDCLAQFYIYDENPNSDVCKNYFRLTDREAMKSLLTGKKFGQSIFCNQEENSSIQNANKMKKNPLTYLCRDIVWNSRRWESKRFWSWVEDFAPECILLQADNSSFMPNLAIRIADRYEIPIVIFNTENYYFKKHNYFWGSGFGFVYPFYRKCQNKAFKKLMRRSSAEIYNSALLASLYEQEFKKEGTVIYQGTSLESFPEPANNKNYRFFYAGNLGLNRHKSLIEIAGVLQKLSPKYILDVYGSGDQAVVDQLRGVGGVRYHGVVSYDKVVEAMKESDFVCHVESFEPEMVKDLVTAFSTKISDYLASGRCIILYADETLACSKYLLENDCACVITKREELFVKIEGLLHSPNAQKEYIQKASAIAKRNHDYKKNSMAFREIIVETLKNYKYE